MNQRVVDRWGGVHGKTSFEAIRFSRPLWSFHTSSETVSDSETKDSENRKHKNKIHSQDPHTHTHTHTPRSSPQTQKKGLHFVRGWCSKIMIYNCKKKYGTYVERSRLRMLQVLGRRGTSSKQHTCATNNPTCTVYGKPCNEERTGSRVVVVVVQQ